MKKSAKAGFITSSVLFALFIIFTILVKVIDFRPIGPNDTSVGFASINQWVFNAISVNEFWATITDILLYLSILVILAFVCLAIIQFFKRKNILKIDREVLFLGLIYLAVFAIYLFFEFVVINYRPIIIDGELNPSYPSTHTLIICVVMLTAFIACDYLIKNKNINLVIKIATIGICALTVAGRLCAGVHWFTDIFAGLLISFALMMLYYALLQEFCNKDKIDLNAVSIQENTETNAEEKEQEEMLQTSEEENEKISEEEIK